VIMKDARQTGALTTATYVLIHGAGDVGWYWHLVEADLRARGHDVVVMDLPVDDDSAGLSEYADVVVEAIGNRGNLIVVAQSFGGYIAPIVCDRLPAKLLVLVAGMVPSRGESAEEMFTNTGYKQEEQKDPSPRAVFYHDVPPALAAKALSRGRDQSSTPGKEPWPLAAWPDVPTRYLLCRNDRFFPPAWVRRVVRDRLGITPDEIESGHCPALSRPRELVERLESYGAALTLTNQARGKMRIRPSSRRTSARAL
jgi:pimeloyl-ACP methyl ester carboxylesterase